MARAARRIGMKAHWNCPSRTLAWVAAAALLMACGEPARRSDPATRGAAAGARDSARAPGAAATPDSAPSGDSAAASHAAAASDSPPAPDSPDAAAAAAVIRRYYEAINARQFRTAYQLWGERGEASGRSFAEFAAGFAETRRVTVETGEPGRIGAAAGSRYVEIPVVIRAVTADGRQQRFEGSYTLRRAVVDGATAAQRRWHIYTAQVRRIR